MKLGAVPIEGIPELASIAYAQVTWGREPHPSQVSEAEFAAWEDAKPRWVAAVRKMLEAMQGEGQIEII